MRTQDWMIGVFERHPVQDTSNWLLISDRRHVRRLPHDVYNVANLARGIVFPRDAAVAADSLKNKFRATVGRSWLWFPFIITASPNQATFLAPSAALLTPPILFSRRQGRLRRYHRVKLSRTYVVKMIEG